MTNQISEENLYKVEFIKALLEIEPKITKVPKNANGKNKVFTISGTVKDLGNRTETDHESQMIAYLCEKGLIYDRTRPTKDELDITKDRLVGLFSHGTTEIQIFDKNKKGSVIQLTNKSFWKYLYPKSETTKAWDAISRDMKKYPELSDQLKTTSEEVHQMRKMHFLRDQLLYFVTEYENTFGNSMVKNSNHEKFEITLKNLMNQFQALNIIQLIKQESVESNLASSKNASSSNNPYLLNNSKKVKTEIIQ
ncbi:hypothetical protein C2G38_2213207 [Gigaspora rosea]|uniref:Uncharacterized protein n=1 Tax=Gigaspora rosea TaxID=44941 RepID=A0A397UKG9_9GLOM|nr:hypothetical protein C2G38_2213207 [Gigaspora rosea]